MDKPWVEVREVCGLYGVTFETAKNKVSAGTFDVPTYRIGKKLVIDREVHETYFRRLREAGLRALDESTRCGQRT